MGGDCSGLIGGVGGLGMLVYQAAESFRLWTGQDAPIEKMREAARAALGGEAAG